MKKIFFILIVFFTFLNVTKAQSDRFRYKYRNEVYLACRYNKNNYEAAILPGIGYEFSFNKHKYYASISNEFSTHFASQLNVGTEVTSILKLNRQSQNILSIGAGFKHQFKVKQTNIVLLGGAKFDLFKSKMTVGANVMFEYYKGLKNSGPGISSNVCVGNCNWKYLPFWHYSLYVGKYF